MTKSSEITELLKVGMKQKDIVEKLQVDKGLVSRLNHKLKSESKSIDQPVDSTSQPTKSTKNLNPGKSPNQGSTQKIQIKNEIRHLVNLLGVNSKFYKEEGFKGTLEIREHISSLLDQL